MKGPSQSADIDVDNVLGKWIIEPDVWIVENAFSRPGDAGLREQIDAEADWVTHVIRMFGREIESPRRTAYQADPGVSYSYSGITLEPASWTDAVSVVKRRVEKLTGERFNSVLLNKYRGGSDSMGWHADDEPELGPEPVIASVTFGAERRFLLKSNETGETIETVPPHGSLLVMGGRSQHDYKHAVPKTKREVGERINLTFRRILR